MSETTFAAFDAGDLPGRLATAVTVSAAAETVVDVLVEAGLPMPALYLARGGRLRCVAVRGHAQVYDGLLPSSGTVGATFRTGEIVDTRRTGARAGDVRPAGHGLDEVCVPVLVDGVPVGVLTVASGTILPEETPAVLVAAAAAFADRLAALGGAPPETPAQRLSRHATAMSVQDRPERLWTAACAGARDLAGLDSAALVLIGPEGRHELVCADGPMAHRLAGSVASGWLAALGGWAAGGGSCWTLPPRGLGARPELQALQRSGAGTALVVPVVGEEGVLGFLLVVGAAVAPPRTDTVELLELLSLHLAGCLRTMRAFTALQELANRDPLTGLGHHAAFRGALAAALQATAPHRVVAVVLLDVDDFKRVNDTRGHLVGDTLLCDTARTLSASLRVRDRLFRIGGDEFAAVVRVTCGLEAEALGRRLRDAARRELPVTVSVGVAAAGYDTSPDEVFVRADQALYAAKHAGRDAVRLAPAPDRPPVVGCLAAAERRRPACKPRLVATT